MRDRWWARFRPHLALFPSTVPETFCYTLSIGFAGGLYCIGIDLGAIGRRIRESGRGELFPLNTPPSAINDLLLEAAHRAAALTKSPVPEHLWKSDYASLLTDYYQLRFTPEPVKCPPQQIAVCSA